MTTRPQVVAFMTPFPYSIDIDAPLEEARKLLRAHDFRHLPVTANGTVAGILTDRDIKLLLGPDLGNPSADELKVRDAYVERACVVPASASIAAVARTMADNHIGSAIVTKNDKLVGIFTVTDACRALARILEERAPPPDGAA